MAFWLLIVTSPVTRVTPRTMTCSGLAAVSQILTQSSPTRCAKARPGVVSDSVAARMTRPAEASRQLLNLFIAFSLLIPTPLVGLSLCPGGTFCPLTFNAETAPARHNAGGVIFGRRPRRGD